MSFDGLKKVAQQSQTLASFVLIKTLHPPPIPTHHHHWWIKGCCWTGLIVSLRPLNTRSKLRSSELHCAALWWSRGKSDSRFAWRSRATPLAHKWKPIFFWISLPIFTCILLHQQNSKKKKKKAGALFINTACTLHAPPMPFHFKMNMHVILGMHTRKKDEALWQQTPDTETCCLR